MACPWKGVPLAGDAGRSGIFPPSRVGRPFCGCKNDTTPPPQSLAVAVGSTRWGARETSGPDNLINSIWLGHCRLGVFLRHNMQHDQRIMAKSKDSATPPAPGMPRKTTARPAPGPPKDPRTQRPDSGNAGEQGRHPCRASPPWPCSPRRLCWAVRPAAPPSVDLHWRTGRRRDPCPERRVITSLPAPRDIAMPSLRGLGSVAIRARREASLVRHHENETSSGVA